MSHLLLYSTTIFLSRWWESIPMGIGVIPIPILIDSHFHSHCLFNFCPIPIGFPFPCTNSTIDNHYGNNVWIRIGRELTRYERRFSLRHGIQLLWFKLASESMIAFHVTYVSLEMLMVDVASFGILAQSAFCRCMRPEKIAVINQPQCRMTMRRCRAEYIRRSTHGCRDIVANIC